MNYEMMYSLANLYNVLIVVYGLLIICLLVLCGVSLIKINNLTIHKARCITALIIFILQIFKTIILVILDQLVIVNPPVYIVKDIIIIIIWGLVTIANYMWLKKQKRNK